MKEKMISHPYQTKTYDVDEEKGIVTVAVNGIGVLDSQGDISMPGSFTKTLQENIGRMKWLYNHNTHEDIGVPISGEEKDNNLLMTGKLYDTQLSREILNKYKVNAELGHTLEHSICVQAIKRDEKDKRKVLEWRMFEYSTLSFLGANPDTYLVDLKCAKREDVENAVTYISRLMQEKGFSDDTLKRYDENMQLLLKALKGGNIVTCPRCGTQFDYDEQTEVGMSEQILEIAADYARWIAEGVVAERMAELEPEIRAQVTALIDEVYNISKESVFTEKSLEDFMSYVRCPYCWSKVYKSNTLMEEQSEPVSPKASEPSEDDTRTEEDEDVEETTDKPTEENADGQEDEEEDKKGAADTGTSFDLKALNECFKQV